ncbi:MAG: glycosyltransferase family 2 protein [Oscillospiraceae bacterium]|nr:glycosyltransferase family 2 protein [Oscillospiraceae bacterium]
MRITVFTPAYNRAYTIEKLYCSLRRQSFKDFEWIVIDDGSTDGTEKLFERILEEENFFPIQYYQIPNGGKHRAINRGVRIAKGNLFFIVDSDDYLTDDALELVDRIEKSIPDDEKSEFAGVCGLRGKTVDSIIGSTFEGNTLDITSLEREENGIFGDKAEVFYTEVLKKYPFPEFEGENFLTEAVVWMKIAEDGLKLRYFNEIIYIGEYLPDGLSANIREMIKRNPNGYALYISQLVRYGKLNGFAKWQSYYDYYYSNRDTKSFREMAERLNINRFVLWFRLFGMKIFYRIYS